MKGFKIYAGLAGGFGGATFQDVYECIDKEDATQLAREIAEDIYESYCGNHGLTSFDDILEDLEGYGIDSTLPSETIDEYVNDVYRECMENWITYRVEEV